MNKTSIEWCDLTWNPIRARVKPEHVSNPAYKPTHSGTFCTRISPGCTNCYASVINKRFGNGLEYTVPNLEKVEFFIDEKILAEPLRRKKSARIFVGDMFDLFHEAITSEQIAQVFAVIALCENHVFQILTKRAERMYDIFQSAPFWEEVATQAEAIGYTISPCIGHRVEEIREGEKFPWPYLWLGVSVESQKYADERIPLLLQTPAAVRFLSVEPMLEAVDLHLKHFEAEGMQPYFWHSPKCESFCDYACGGVEVEGPISWVICGGESGPGARPFNLAWAESLLGQCRSAGVPFFMKQIGSNPVWPNEYWKGLRPPKLLDRKGGEMSEWPESLRVREFPASQKREAVSV